MSMVTFFVSDVHRSLEFYKAMFNLAPYLGYVSEDYTLLQLPNIMLCLRKREANESVSYNHNSVMLTFMVPEMSEVVQVATQAGAVLMSKDPAEADRITMRDPDGILIQLQQQRLVTSS